MAVRKRKFELSLAVLFYRRIIKEWVVVTLGSISLELLVWST